MIQLGPRRLTISIYVASACLLFHFSVASASFRDHPKFVPSSSNAAESSKKKSSYIVWMQEGAQEESLETLDGFDESYIKFDLKVVLNGGYVLAHNIPGKRLSCVVVSADGVTLSKRVPGQNILQLT